MTRMWLDDQRPVPDATWTVVKTADAAITLLKTGQVQEASLDYDINWEPGSRCDDWNWPNTRTGFAVLMFLSQNHVLMPRDGVAIHSSNQAGAARMLAMLAAIRKDIERAA